MGVCCIVFDIDGMLFEFFMNFLNIEFCFQYFKFSSRFMLYPTLKKIGVKKKSGGGGGGEGECGTIISHFTLYSIFNIKKNIEKCPFTYWLNSREGQLESIYIISSIPLFCISNVGVVWGGGGV